jgi:putative protein-disulfide isomerase
MGAYDGKASVCQHAPMDGKFHLIYFADPMCSWCYGFSPVIAAVQTRYGEALPVHLILGGLRAGATEPMGAEDMASIREHWEHVHELTGQPFDWRFFERDHFVYDTEPACRAVVVLRRQGPETAMAALRRLHETFYAGNRDITDAQTLAGIAAELGVDRDRFLADWHSEEAKAHTKQDFALTQGSGVQGFPTLIAGRADDDGYSLITRGYQPVEAVTDILERWLSMQEAS